MARSITYPELTEKQACFCVEFIRDRNATQAAIRAGYSKISARQIAHVLMKNEHIRRIITGLQQKQMAQGNLILEQMQQVLMDIIAVNPASLYRTHTLTITTKGGERVKVSKLIAKNPEELTPQEQNAVAEMKPTAQGPVIKTYNKLGAIKELRRQMEKFGVGGLGKMEEVASPRVSPPVYQEQEELLAA